MGNRKSAFFASGLQVAAVVLGVLALAPLQARADRAAPGDAAGKQKGRLSSHCSVSPNLPMDPFRRTASGVHVGWPRATAHPGTSIAHAIRLEHSRARRLKEIGAA